MGKFALTLLGCTIISALWAQTPDHLAHALLFDRQSVNVLQRNHKRLPKDLKAQIAAIDLVMAEMGQSDQFKNGHVATVFKPLRRRIAHLEQKVENAQLELLQVERAVAQCEVFAHNNPGISLKNYRQYRDRTLGRSMRSYEKEFRNINRLARKTILSVLLYTRAHYWDEEPLVTTAIDTYLKNMTGKWMAGIDSLNAVVENLKNEKAALDAENKTIREANRLLLHDSLLYSKSLDSLMLAFDRQQRAQTEIMANTNHTLAGKQNELLLRQLELDSLRRKYDLAILEYADMRAKSKSLSDALDYKSNDLEAMVQAQENMQQRLQQQKDELDAQKIVAQGESERANRNRTTKNILFGIALFFVLLSLWSQFNRVVKVRKAKEKLELLNIKLAQTNEKLEEKHLKSEALARELHHRTKNSLQQIAALLHLQAVEIDDVKLKTVLDEARGRIDALGIIHRQLYQNKTLTTVNIAEYIEELVRHLSKCHNNTNARIRTHFNPSDIFIEMDTAIHIGLIVNELIGNCFKHAFPNTPHPQLDVSLEADPNTLWITLRDNGPGLPAAIDLENANSLGLKLVRLLVGDPDRFAYKNDQGAVFKIEVPLAEAPSSME